MAAYEGLCGMRHMELLVQESSPSCACEMLALSSRVTDVSGAWGNPSVRAKHCVYMEKSGILE